ncbi:MAG: PQQ-like beta-propeller repeat protein, partial [Verrucomicrobia bacterium]|nr:PQQ-like beta-propeller repeat protein [Verrucomicrobiota bacterium]
MKCRNLIVLTCCVISSGTWLPAAFAQGSRGAEAALAKEVLQTSGVKSGLILHLGCGRTQTPGLTAALAAQSGWLVHGLALDDAACARARRAIEAKGLAGRAMVERINFKDLPYLTDLANLVVVEDLAALAARGVSRDELMRVLAPGGVLCVREGARWTRTVNPRPREMDDWTHPQHGADGNMVSEDRLVRFPLGLRWLDGLPLNLNRWAACRGWVVANGRVFTLSSTELENVGAKEKPHYLTARDAWNGLPLWKINCETFDDGAFLRWENVPPLAADDRRVYAPKKDKLIAADAATGAILRTFPTKFPPTRLLLTDGVLVVGCWEAREPSKAPFDRTSLWATWVAKSTTGTVEAYDAAGGDLKWSLPLAALKMVAADGAVYLLMQAGNPPTERHVVAVDLKTGKERWRVSNTAFGPEADLDLTCTGHGY